LSRRLPRNFHWNDNTQGLHFVFTRLRGAQGLGRRSRAWTDVLDAVGVRTSMNGKGRWIDNVFIECLWRSVKYKDIYLRAYENGRELQAGLTALTRLLA
jgi:transposase InsO family protein